MQRAPCILSLSSEMGSYISFQSSTRSSTGFRLGPSRAYFMNPFGSPICCALRHQESALSPVDSLTLHSSRFVCGCLLLPFFEYPLVVDRHDFHEFRQGRLPRV